MNNRFLNVFFHFLPLGAAIFLLSCFTYVSVQQYYRQALNDPQVEVTEDAANALASGAVPADIVPRGTLLDASKSLDPFIAVYDSAGNPLEASASIGNVPPKPPKGVFDYAKLHSEDRVTWQPNAETRIALVVVYVPSKDEFVASGRNMKEVEARIEKFTQMFITATILILLISFGFDFIGDSYRRRVMSMNNIK